MSQVTNNPQASLLNKVWITAKCRMGAEARYRRYHLAANLFVSYYSLLVILASVFTSEITPYVPSIDKIVIALSIGVFCWSLVLLGFRFSETADKHRECYLRLQRILDNPAALDVAAEYHNVLERYPNHETTDYSNLVVERAIFRRRPITDTSEIPASISTVLFYFVRAGCRLLAWLLFITLPILVGAFLYFAHKMP